MPFLDHFGLTSYPFGLTPNTKLYYPSQHAESVLAALEFAAARGDGLLKVTGEIGTGKTLLCRLFLEKQKALPVNTAYLNAPAAPTAAQMPLLVAREFGLNVDKKDPAIALRDYLVAQHAKGRRNILIVDEAQALGVEGLEAIRLLSNLETETDKLLQIVLFGQPELDQLLHRPDMRQLLQRVSFSFVTRPLTTDAVSNYLRHRLTECTKKGGRGRKKQVEPNVTFTPRAVRKLARASGGMPRLIHVLADKALLAAYAKGENMIDAPHINVACRETPGLAFPWNLLTKI